MKSQPYLRLLCSRDDSGDCSGAVSHPYFELLYVEGSAAPRAVDSDAAEPQRDSLRLVAPGTAHVHDAAWRRSSWRLEFDGTVVDFNVARLLASLAIETRGVLACSEHRADRAHWINRFRYLHGELRRGTPGSDLLVRSLLNSMMLDVVRLAPAPHWLDVARRRRLFDDVFEFIESKYRYPISLRDVARAVQRSPAYLTDLVRRETGLPINHWIANRRICAAQVLLAESDAPIASVARDAGYSDASYFCRQFYKATGHTPRSWRALCRRYRCHRRPLADPAWDPGAAATHALDIDYDHFLEELVETFDCFAIPIAIALDPECKTIKANQALADILNISIDQNASLSGPAAEKLPLHLAVATAAQVCDMQVEFVRDDGVAISLLASAAPLRDLRNKVRGSIVVCVDVTERRRLETEMIAARTAADSMRHIQTIADMLPQLVWTRTNDGTIDYVNDRWVKYTGFQAEDCSDSKWLTVVHPDDRKRILTLWKRAVVGGKDYEAYVRFRRASDGAWRWHLSRGVAVRDEQRKVVKWVGTSTDVHDEMWGADQSMSLLKDLLEHDKLGERSTK